MRFLRKHDIAVIACLVIALYVLYFSYPPYAVPVYVSHLTGCVIILYALVRFGMGRGKVSISKTLLRIVFGVLAGLAEVIRTA